ncbi:MAG: nucleoid-associated protein, partial [Armatimonadota bacterium]|nr:nucleoid-associated protein [Armatimonadota bacterium]
VDEGARLRLVRTADLLPPPERRIQKCAFVPASPHFYPYDLMLLDHQTGNRDEGKIAAFFSEDFLECALLDGPKEFTRRLPQETERWLQEEGVAPTVAIQARQAIIQAIHEPEVNLDQLADEVFGESDQRTSFLNHLQSSGFETRSFATDQGTANRLSSTLTYILDNGIRISGEAEAMADLLEVDPEPTAEGKARIVIESMRFERRY